MDQPRQPRPVRTKFTPAEDQHLRELIHIFGTNEWRIIATQMGRRNARQCRERWANYLNPALVNEPWTSTEDALLEEKYKELGCQWHLISAFFPNRSKNQIKNHWLANQKKHHEPEKGQIENIPLEPEIEMEIPEKRTSFDVLLSTVFREEKTTKQNPEGRRRNAD
jgi:hypothetical protein